jgi:glycosyltransferase involved in cell wall biosynthesis
LYKVILISPGQPSSNPRLQKEALALFHAGYHVTVIYSFWVRWADSSDASLIKQFPAINWVRAGGHPTDEKGLYLYTRVRHKLYKYLARAFSFSRLWNEKALARAGNELEKTAKALFADLYIAHNLAALPPAQKAAAKHRTKYAFDAEDYHRGQETPGSLEYKQVVLTEDSYLPGVAYCTAASPLIGAAYAKKYDRLHPQVVNNVFSRDYLQPRPADYRKGDILKLFWFSQTVGHGRGLEESIKALGRIRTFPVTLTILGYASETITSELKELALQEGLGDHQLIFHGPVPLDEIFPLAHEHHIGLALEVTTIENRQICLTNKIFTYLLAGLFIAATDTQAQALFLKDYEGVGATYLSGDDAALADLLITMANDPAKLNASRERARALADTRLNWEAEQGVLLQQIKKILP